jgi:1,4-alpha-glucan branching enzyme
MRPESRRQVSNSSKGSIVSIKAILPLKRSFSNLVLILALPEFGSTFFPFIFAVHRKMNFDVKGYSPLKKKGYELVVKPVNFICIAPQAKQVSLVGDFNGWNPEANPMQRRPDGAWMTTVELKHGHHRYLFLVDGQPQLDPRAQGVARNEKNERVSLVSVS